MSRYALNRLQISGQTGRVAGTDSQQALLAGGFTFPFAEDLLVPAIPLFGTKTLADAGAIRLGGTKSELVLAIGPWCVALTIDRAGRFPDVRSVVPHTPSPTVLQLEDADAATLLEALPSLPGHDDENAPVTLDLADRAAVRARGDNSKTIREVPLARSTVKGAAVRIALNRNFLQRLLTLGLRQIKVASPDQPFVASNDELLYLAMPLDQSAIVEPSRRAAGPGSTNGSVALPTPPTWRTSPMKTPETNGPTPLRGPLPADELDPLAEAEGLRTALIEATQRAGRLLAALRGRNKEKKALATVWAGLKQLNLRP